MGNTMKIVLKTFVIAALAIPTLSFANTAKSTSQAQVVDGKVTVASPRTGIRYTIDNPHQRLYLFKLKQLQQQHRQQ